MKKTSLEVERKVVQLYLNNVKLKDIESITGCKCIKHILKRNKISRNRNPKEYTTNKKEERNQKLIEEYLMGDLSVIDLSKKYNITDVNLYRILKQYNISSQREFNHHWGIHKKRKENPNMKCKFYILENYYGYTKIGITTKNKIKERFGKKVNVVFEIESTLDFCYNLELKLKKQFKKYIPKNIDKKVDGWSECYTLHPSEIISQMNIIKEGDYYA